MDDFGSGYSSLNVLKEIPVDILKLDRVSFSSENDKRGEDIVETVISLAKKLGMETIAEGIETIPQVELLKSMECDAIQGYVFSKPVPVDQFETLVQMCIRDRSHAIGEYVFGHGFSLPRDYAGHGIGTSVHEDPTVPNFGPAGHGILLKEGMTLAIEPLVLAGRPHTRTLADGWGVVTKDGGLAAHYEHTIVITEKGYEILTEIKEEEHPSNG